MDQWVRIECRECAKALRVLELGLPDELQDDELFERHCPTCEKTTYMGVVAEVLNRS